MAVGQAVQRVDGVAKVTGKARYADDFTMPGMRVAKYLRSTIAHGKGGLYRYRQGCWPAGG
jgi:xanthine dehydrogenase molybdenum-binding subunit